MSDTLPEFQIFRSALCQDFERTLFLQGTEKWEQMRRYFLFTATLAATHLNITSADIDFENRAKRKAAPSSTPTRPEVVVSFVFGLLYGQVMGHSDENMIRESLLFRS